MRYGLRFLAALGFLILVLGLMACGSDPMSRSLDGATLEGKLVLTGSSTVAPLVSEIGRRFESLHPGVRVDVQTGGSSRGIADAGTGVADIGMSSRALTESEAQHLTEHRLAYDGVAFLVHQSNPVVELEDDQLRAIYTGQIRDWQGVGGAEQPLTVVHRAEGRSEVQLVTEYLGLESTAIRADLIAGENQQGIKTVATDPSAIVYMSIGASQRDIEAGTPVKLLPLRGVEATAETVAADRFPLARPLILLTAEEPSDLATTFIEFATSSQVDDLILSLAYVPPAR